MSRSRSRSRDGREGSSSGGRRRGGAAARDGNVRMLKFLLAHRHVGSVIGRAGAMINTIQDKSGAKVTISRSKDPRYPGSDERIGCARGDAASILTAMSLIVSEVQDCEDQENRQDDDGVADDDGHGERHCHVTVLIPDRAAGSVIGRRGETVTRLQKESGATIVVARSNDCKHATQLSKERPVEIKCLELRGLLHAIGSLLAALATSKHGPEYENETLEYPRDHAHGRNTDRDGRENGGRRDRGGRADRGRDNSGVGERYDERSRGRDRGGGGGRRDAGMGTYNRDDAYTEVGSASYDSYAGGRDGVDDTYDRDYDSDYRGRGHRRDLRQDSFDDRYDDRHERRSRRDSFGYDDSQSSNRGRNRSRSPPPRLDALATTEVQIGDHLVAKILGNKGFNIRRIERETGAKISVSKRGVFYPGTNNRIVTIQGQHDVMGRVQSLLQLAISAPERQSAVPNVIMPLGSSVGSLWGGGMGIGGGAGAAGGVGGRGRGWGGEQGGGSSSRSGVGINGAMIGGRDLVKSALEAGPGKSLPGCYIVAISDSCIGAVLGHRGAALHKMRNDTGAIVEVSKRDEFFEGGDEQRAIVLKGMPGQILQCQQQILELLSQNGYHVERQSMQHLFANAGMGVPSPNPLEPQPLTW